MIRRFTFAALALALWACSTKPPPEVLQPIDVVTSGRFVEDVDSGSGASHDWRLTRADDGCLYFIVDEQLSPGCMKPNDIGGGMSLSGLSRDLWFISGHVVEDTRTAPEVTSNAAGQPVTLRVVFADGSTRDTPVQPDNVSRGVTAYGYLGPASQELVGYFLLDAAGLVHTSWSVYDPNTKPS